MLLFSSTNNNENISSTYIMRKRYENSLFAFLNKYFHTKRSVPCETKNRNTRYEKNQIKKTNRICLLPKYINNILFAVGSLPESNQFLSIVEFNSNDEEKSFELPLEIIFEQWKLQISQSIIYIFQIFRSSSFNK